MGFLNSATSSLAAQNEKLGPTVLLVLAFVVFVTLLVLGNILHQLLLQNPNEPPVVFHWFPIIGSTITYGIDPYKFFFSCREKYGDVFTFILLGKKTTVCLGKKGNDFILNAKLKDANAEEIYQPLTAPVFGKGVVYDCPNAKLMEQKKFVKFGLSTEALQSYVPIIVQETVDFVQKSQFFNGSAGLLDVPTAMAELTIYTASRCLQGVEVREKLNSAFADLYHDLDAGFSPINFMLPWAPLPQNRKRDQANQKMTDTYMEIIQNRKKGTVSQSSQDMIWNLMACQYKDGTPVPDEEVAHMMIALLMAGQHSSSSTSSWILLRLALNPHIAEELVQEQKRVLGDEPLSYENLKLLTLNSQVVKETLRIHAPIHSIMRQVKSPMQVEGTPYTIPPQHVLLAAPGVTSKSTEYFKDPEIWDPHRWDLITETKDDEKVDYGYGLVSKGANSPYLPFGAGRHRCIGEQFAYLQLGTIIATLIKMFKFSGPHGQSQVVGTDYSSLFSQPLRPAMVEWESRTKKEE